MQGDFQLGMEGITNLQLIQIRMSNCGVVVYTTMCIETAYNVVSFFIVAAMLIDHMTTYT